MLRIMDRLLQKFLHHCHLEESKAQTQTATETRHGRETGIGLTGPDRGHPADVRNRPNDIDDLLEESQLATFIVSISSEVSLYTLVSTAVPRRFHKILSFP